MITITSFSYKGGAGRTVASANIAAALAAKQPRASVLRPLNYKVAIIDLDVFSAGLHRVFEIRNSEIQEQHEHCIQDYLLHEIEPADFIGSGGVTPASGLMERFRGLRGAQSCRDDFTVFPARPTPDSRFTVQKYHENNMFSLLYALERQGFDYVFIDGESGTRAMADIAVRLADVVLMFFRLTWQHIEGSLVTIDDFLKKPNPPAFYLIPTCVPLVAADDGVYQTMAPGLDVLRERTEMVPRESELNEKTTTFASRSNGSPQAYGYFWSNRVCIHDSLMLKGEERVVVYDPEARAERAAADYYRIADEISTLHKP